MKKSLITMMAAALMSASAFAGDASVTTESAIQTPSQDFKRLSGAAHIGVGTAYTCHGYVPTTAAVQGEGYAMAAVQAAYDFGKESFWSYTGAISYKAPFSGHTLYGNPKNPHPYAGVYPGVPKDLAEAIGTTLNIENELIVRNGVKYTRDMWNVGMGYDFIHGGIAGVIAKHFDKESDSYMQQCWVSAEVTPVAWFSADVQACRTFDTVTGWWFEAHARFKAPIIGSPEDITVAGILEFGVSATKDFYADHYHACDNGIQAYWIKLSTPWFMNEDKNIILTPSVSFNWLGKDGKAANKNSKAKALGDKYVPFRDFAIVGDLTLSYKF